MQRRRFLKSSAVAAGAALFARVPSSARANPVGANDAVRLAIIGLGRKGIPHLKQLLEVRDVRIAALCDVDPHGTEMAKAKGVQPFTSTDAREVLARRDVDAVLVVTGNHWHALLTVWACQAGKDVYVEKPMSHTIWEGRKMVEAAARYNRIVQVGMQYSSETGLREAREYLRSGKLGRIQHIRTIYYGKRDSIGRREPWYPQNVNYDLFCGPAPMVPLERNQLHYDWHWMWDTGNGDLGNNGVHLLGVALQMTARTGLPRRILSLGGRFVIDDVAETPNTMMTVYDYPDFPIIYEQRGLPAKPGVSYMDQSQGMRGVGVIVKCEGGHVAGLTGATAYDNDGKVIEKFTGDGGAGHMRNFLEAVKSRRSRDLAAPAEFGHLVAAVCHHGNISYRLGAPAKRSRVERAFAGNASAQGIFAELEQHLGVHGIDLERQTLTLGQWVQSEHANDSIVAVESGREEDLARARFLLRETQRPPYVIPDQV
jgi:hypothetical protein